MHRLAVVLRHALWKTQSKAMFANT